MTTETIAACAGSFIAGFGGAYALIKLIVGKVVAELRTALRKDFLTREEATLIHTENERRFVALEKVA